MEGGVNEGEIFSTVYSFVPFGFTYSKLNFKIKHTHTYTHKTIFKRANSVRKSAPSFLGGSLVKNAPASAKRHRFNS